MFPYRFTSCLQKRCGIIGMFCRLRNCVCLPVDGGNTLGAASFFFFFPFQGRFLIYVGYHRVNLRTGSGGISREDSGKVPLFLCPQRKQDKKIKLNLQIPVAHIWRTAGGGTLVLTFLDAGLCWAVIPKALHQVSWQHIQLFARQTLAAGSSLHFKILSMLPYLSLMFECKLLEPKASLDL